MKAPFGGKTVKKTTRVGLSLAIGFLLAVLVDVFVGPAHLLSSIPHARWLVLALWFLYSVALWLLFFTATPPRPFLRALKSLGVGGLVIGLAVLALVLGGYSINIAGAVFVWLLASGVALGTPIVDSNNRPSAG
ncbi:MAG: hypothetical protein HYW89_02735 [Candidatus Sungiibacteriota bacterium]|uniref:Uncharacterized protein n=1 Tax=Candidatus Sungiibacteriota bacterium TaxID=2750080 RepID=A0A7T5RIR1_9BACT|nr:MAG: hypothetical protein HYW89_02735 [Candidatus Sungbacteria bacterium]